MHLWPRFWCAFLMIITKSLVSNADGLKPTNNNMQSSFCFILVMYSIFVFLVYSDYFVNT